MTEHEVRTCLAVFSELRKKPYDEINTYLGSLTIEEMCALDNRMRALVLGKEVDGDE